MPIPNLDITNDLPVGVHPATLQEIANRFGSSNARRKILIARLERIYQVATSTGKVARFIVFGSFITDKPEPNDVDVFMIMEDDFDVSALSWEAQRLFDHNAADVSFGASVFWLRRLAAFGGEQATVEYWQVKRGGGFRGIIEVIGD